MAGGGVGGELLGSDPETHRGVRPETPTPGSPPRPPSHHPEKINYFLQPAPKQSL